MGLTCRIGRAVYGTLDLIHDVVEMGKSILFLGRPGVGKTTMCREAARILSGVHSLSLWANPPGRAARSGGYRHLDYADLGDLESDPFVRSLQLGVLQGERGRGLPFLSPWDKIPIGDSER